MTFETGLGHDLSCTGQIFDWLCSKRRLGIADQTTYINSAQPSTYSLVYFECFGAVWKERASPHES